jgi:hypothetical protein
LGDEVEDVETVTDDEGVGDGGTRQGGSKRRKKTTEEQGPQAGVDYPDAEGWTYDPDEDVVHAPNGSIWFMYEATAMFAIADRQAAEQVDTTKNAFDMITTVYGADDQEPPTLQDAPYGFHKDGTPRRHPKRDVQAGQVEQAGQVDQVEPEQEDFQNTFSTWNTTFDTGDDVGDTLQNLTEQNTQSNNTQTLQPGQNAVDESAFFGAGGAM